MDDLAKSPKRLFKFKSFSGDSFKHVLDIIENNRMRFAFAREFNDPFDCNFPLDMKQRQCRDIVVKTCNHLIKSGSLSRPAGEWGHLKNALKNVFLITQLGKDWRFRHEVYAYLMSDLGIISFCGQRKKNDSVIWSHYANFHYGICFEFQTDKKWFKDSNSGHYIKYENKIEPLTCKDFYNNKWKFRVGTTKSKAWKYENEFRLMSFNKAGKYLKFDKKCLKSVYFGLKTLDEKPNQIKRLLRDKGYSCDIHYMIADSRRFKLSATKKSPFLMGENKLFFIDVNKDLKKLRSGNP